MKLRDAQHKIKNTVIPDCVFMGNLIQGRLNELADEIEIILPIVGNIEIPENDEAAEILYDDLADKFRDNEIAVAEIFMEVFSVIQKLI